MTANTNLDEPVTGIDNYDDLIHKLLDKMAPVPVNLYVLRFRRADDGSVAPGSGIDHLIFSKGKIATVKQMENEVERDLKKSVVLQISIKDPQEMSHEEIADLKSNDTKQAVEARTILQASKGQKANKYYPIGVGFNPLSPKIKTEGEIEKAAKFCRSATPFLEGNTMSVLFKKGMIMDHLSNYQLLIQRDDGVIGLMDPPTPHIN